MARRDPGSRLLNLAIAGGLFALSSLASAQQAAQSVTSPTTSPRGTQPDREQPGHAQPGHTRPGRIQSGQSQSGIQSGQTQPGRSQARGSFGSGSQLIFPGNNPADVLDSNSGAPRPTWELPRTVTPQWEIPNYNPVQPNAVQGNPPAQGAFGGGLGGFVGYGGVPYYSFIDPSADLTTDQSAGPSADPSQAGAYPPGSYSGDEQVNGAGPGGPPPDGRYDPRLAEYPPPDNTRGARSYAQRPPYRPEREPFPAAQPQRPSDPSDGLDHPEITLIFRDGRAPLKIHSYVLTGTTLLAIEDGHQTRIPLTELDLPATEERNRATGADFTPPGGSR